jgi:hypothetical protein
MAMIETAMRPSAAAAAAVARRRDDLFILAVCLVGAIGLAVARGPAFILTGPLDPDSMTRLVEVRDWLAGRAFTDMLQPRIGPPDGTVMHWSPLPDLVIGALLSTFSRWMPQAEAEAMTVSVYPVLVMLPYLWAVVSLGRRLAGDDAALPSLLFGFSAAPCLAHFLPGNIDHHNLQIMLYALFLAAAVKPGGRGIAAGLIASLMLTIGLETVHVVAIAGVAFALGYALDPRRLGVAAAGFGLSFAVGLVALRLGTVAPAQWFATECDVASLPYVAVAVVGGGGLAALVALDPGRLVLRLAGLAAVGLAAGAAFLAIEPACAAGPYGALDPRVVALWLQDVAEARTIAAMWGQTPAEMFGTFTAPVLALGYGVWLVTRGPAERARWGMIVASLAAALAVACLQLRAVYFASVLAVPLFAQAAVMARASVAGRPAVIGALVTLAAYLVPNQMLHTGLALWGTGQLAAATTTGPATNGAAAVRSIEAAWAETRVRCLGRNLYSSIAALPKGVVLHPTNLGGPLLAYTPHGVTSPPYHRNQRGILDAFLAFGGTPDEARAIAERWGATYILICSGDGETKLIIHRNPKGLMASLEAGKAPDWLVPVETGAPGLKMWRVIPRDAAAPSPGVAGSDARGALD